MVSIAASQQEGPRLELHKVRAFLYSVYMFSQCLLGCPFRYSGLPHHHNMHTRFSSHCPNQGSGLDLELIPELVRYPPLPWDGLNAAYQFAPCCTYMCPKQRLFYFSVYIVKSILAFFFLTL